MILNSKLTKIHKERIKRINYTKNEIKKIILKSIVQNKNIKPITRALARYKLTQFKKKSSISRQNNNLCLMSGRIKGVFKQYNLSRHFIKKFLTSNNLQNTNIKCW